MTDIYHEAIDMDRNGIHRFINNVVGINEITYQDISLMMRYPDISPCAFDNNLEFWLGRMELWGKLRITYTSPTGKKEKITQGKMIDLMTDSTLINTFGKWDWKKKATNMIEFYRNYYGSDGKKKSESILVDIDLKDNIKQAIKGKY